MKTLLLSSIILLATCAGSLAQSNTEKLFLNVGVVGAGFNSDIKLVSNSLTVFDGDGGTGFNLKAGYGFSPVFTLYLGIGASGMNRNGTNIPLIEGDNQYGLGFFELGGRFNFRDNSKKFRPYAEVALSSVAAVFDDEPESSFGGGGFSFGGGGQYFLNDIVALDASLILTSGSFSQVIVLDQNLNDRGRFFATRFSVGLTLYPLR